VGALQNHSFTHASPTLVPILRRTARMTVRVPLAMSPGLSTSIAEVEAMSDSAFHKRFRSSYESSPSSSLPDLPLRKRYQEDEGPTTKDEDLTAGDKGLAAGDDGPGIRDESLSLGWDEAVPEGQQRVALVVETTVGQSSGSVPEPERPERVSTLRQPTLTTLINTEDGIAYIDVPTYPPPAPPFQALPSPEWSFGSLPVSLVPFIVPLPVSSPMIPLTVPSPVASPAMAETGVFLTELGTRVEMQGGLIRELTIRLGELSPALFERYDRDIRDLFTRSGAVR
ncbi:hypothetical protein Tco_1527862, partial [Tanacetum coccineum]